MQTFTALLSKPIDLSILRNSWFAQSPNPPNPKVKFHLEGQTLVIQVQSGELTPWDKENFCTALRMAIHKIDVTCEVTKCVVKVWHVVGSPGGSTGSGYMDVPRRFYSMDEAENERDRLNKQAGYHQYLVIAGEE